MKWHDYRMVIPEEEKQYLCCQVFGDVPYFFVADWSKNMQKVDEYELPKGAGFYDFDSEWGYYVSGCDYWCEIEWEDKE